MPRLTSIRDLNLPRSETRILYLESCVLPQKLRLRIHHGGLCPDRCRAGKNQSIARGIQPLVCQPDSLERPNCSKFSTGRVTFS